MKKRTLAFFLSLIMYISLLPTAAAANYLTDYPNTWVNTGNQAYDIAQIALTQVGYQETGTNHMQKGLSPLS